MLLHRCKWQLDEKMGATYNHHVRYVNNTYNKNVYIVFDADYLMIKSSIISTERNRRALQNKCADIEFHDNTPLTVAQEKFLTNNKNKSRLIQMLRKKISENNISTCQTKSEADRLIVETAPNLQSGKAISRKYYRKNIFMKNLRTIFTKIHTTYSVYTCFYLL